MIELYKITDLMNGKSYIGCTSVGYVKRWVIHQCPSSTCRLLHEAILEHGAKNFLVEKLMMCSTETLAHNLERMLIKQYQTKTPYGYNMTSGGQGTLGFVATLEHKQKLRANHKGMSGKKHSQKTKRNMSETRKGHPGYWFGKHLSEETIRKRTESRKGYRHSEKTKQKISATRHARRGKC